LVDHPTELSVAFTALSETFLFILVILKLFLFGRKKSRFYIWSVLSWSRYTVL